MKKTILFLCLLAPFFTVFSQEKEKNKDFRNWLDKHPASKGSWVPEIWKKYLGKGLEARLTDFSYAGYQYGEKEIPNISKILGKVTDFGAIPNDNLDDTKAIQHAFDQLAGEGKQGVIFFPKGRYIINGDLNNPTYLKLNACNIVIRGEGSDEDGTILFIANKFLPEKGFGDFVLNIGGEEPSYPKFNTNITVASEKGDKLLTVENSAKFSEGDYVKISMYAGKTDGKYNPELSKTLTYPLKPEPEWTHFAKYAPYESFNQIEKIIDANTISLKVPLRVAIDEKWNPKLGKVDFYTEIGVEDMRFEGAWKGPYNHHGNREMDYGWCALEMNNTVNSWVKNVVFHDFTCDILVSKSKNLTVENVVVSGADGHHGIKSKSASNILVKDVVFTANRTHNIGGSDLMEGCVFTNIDIKNPNGLIDFHGGGFSTANLFENIKNASVAGGGSIKNMPHSGRENTFWNITSMMGHERSPVLKNEFFPSGAWNYHTKTNFSYECYKLYPGSIVVGVYNTNKPVEIDKNSNDRINDFIYVEGLNKPKVWPSSLYKAQLNLRLNYK